MIIWTRLGILVALIAIACLIGGQYLTNTIFSDAQYYQTHSWPPLVALGVAGVVVWLVGSHLNSNSTRRVIDAETNQEMTLNDNHTFFFVPMQYWGFILPVLGIISLFVA